MVKFCENITFNEEEGISEALLLAAKFQEIQVELERIQRESRYEILKVEKKFNEIRKPLYAQRNEAIGLAPEFWPTAFRRHPTLGKLLSKKDQKILKHMVSLEVEVLENGKSHSIIFYFSPNPYFEDEKLTKAYCIDEKNHLSIICQPIKWKEGKGIILDDGHDMGGSFFNWFSEAVRSDGRVDEIAETIKDDLWQDPFRYYKCEVNTISSSSEEENEEEVNTTSSSSEGENEEDVNTMSSSCEEKTEEDINTMSSSSEEKTEEDVNVMSSSHEEKTEEEVNTMSSYHQWKNEEEVNTTGSSCEGKNEEEIDAMVLCGERKAEEGINAMNLYGKGGGEEMINTMGSDHEGKNEEEVDAMDLSGEEKIEEVFEEIGDNEDGVFFLKKH